MSFLRIFALIVIIVLSHVVINTWISPLKRVDMIGVGNDQYLQRLEEMSVTSRADRVLYLSDSVDFYTSPDDEDKGSVSSFIGKKLVSKKFVAIANKAFHAGVYRAFVEYLALQKKTIVEFIIIPINIRSFSTYWIENPSWQFNDLRRYLSSYTPWMDYYYHPAKAFKYYKDEGMHRNDYDQLDIFFEGEKAGKLKQYFGHKFNEPTLENIDTKVHLYYGESITEDNERLNDLIQIATTAHQANIPVLFYLTPVDIAACEKYGGVTIRNRIEENVKFVVATLERRKANVENWAFNFTSDKFYYGEAYPNEHLRQEGRQGLAELIAGKVEVMLAKHSAHQAEISPNSLSCGKPL